jgi:demethylmenaquinone methyltransferase/2-methoxy-6-polyprenyl-1,4-benzoquinol methylase
MPDAVRARTDPARVRAMFGRIAGRYDFLNRVLSLGSDQRWRRRAVRLAGDIHGKTVVDVCCGTGDLALAFAAAGARVLGVDFTPEMLAVAAAKKPLPRGGYTRGDALTLPVPDAAAHAVSIAFGLRNLADRTAGLRELRRVLQPGGVALVLEFGMPRGRLLGGLYRLYFTRALPWVGGVVSGDAAAYRYLPDTVLAWPPAEELEREMAAVGFVETGFAPLSCGIAYLHWGRVSEHG